MGKLLLGIAAVAVVFGVGYWYMSAAGAPAAPADSYSYSTTTAPALAATTTQIATTTTNDTHKVMQATLHTSKGDITIEFLPAAPNTAANFIKLAKANYYDGTKFHRVIKGFMDQGGDPLTKDDSQEARWGTGGPGYQFANENASAHNGVGIVSMANSGPDTNGSQFFINAADNGFLDGKYSVFAKVVSGLDVALAINNTPTDSSDRPLTPVVITSITLK